MGIATVVGVLGMGRVSRAPADRLAKVRGLRADGIDARMYTGAYRVGPRRALQSDAAAARCPVPGGPAP